MKYQIHKGSKYFGANTVFEDIQFEIRNTEKSRLWEETDVVKPPY